MKRAPAHIKRVVVEVANLLVELKRLLFLLRESFLLCIGVAPARARTHLLFQKQCSMPDQQSLVLFWPEHSSFPPDAELLGWAWTSCKQASTVVVAPPGARCNCAQLQHVGQLSSREPSPASRIFSVCDRGLPSLADSDEALVTVLYTPRRRGCCLLSSKSKESASDFARALQLLGALAPHACHRAELHSAREPSLSRRRGRRSQSSTLSWLAALREAGQQPPAAFLLLALDVALGLTASRWLRPRLPSLEKRLTALSAQVLLSAPLRGAAWLREAQPLGVKLHPPLCEAFSDAIMVFAKCLSALGRHVTPLTPPALAALCAAGCLGITLQAALLADAVGVCALPLYALRAIARAWLALHAAGIRNLYVKLYRPRAQQASRDGDGQQRYRMERLTVGALLLTPLLLLAPTLAAYALLVAALAAPPAAARLALRELPSLLDAAFWRCVVLWRSGLGREAWLTPVLMHDGASLERAVYRLRC